MSKKGNKEGGRQQKNDSVISMHMYVQYEKRHKQEGFPPWWAIVHTNIHDEVLVFCVVAKVVKEQG